MKFFINKKEFLSVFAVTLLQQGMVACSTYFLIQLTSSQNNASEFLWQLFGFLACLVLVYIPLSLQKYCGEKWVLSLQRKYVARFKQAFKGRIDLAGNATAEDEKFGFMQREAFHVIDQVTFYWTDLLTTGLNVFLNILVIGATLDSSFFGAYIVSFLIYGVIAALVSQKLGRWSGDAQTARVAHSSVLNKMWSTLLVGNKLNLNQYNKHEETRFGELSDIALKTRVKMEVVQVLTSFATMAPILGLLVYLIVDKLQNPILLVPMIATLHRQIQIVQHIEVIGTLGLQYQSVKSLVMGFMQSLEAPEKQDLQSRIKMDAIVLKTENQRTLIKGPNGAGKSSWLKLKKEELGEKAVYVPANMDLYFENISEEMSSGQRAMAVLKELEEAGLQQQVVLLDEWDANLDTANRELLSQVVEKLSQANQVYEIRHG
ncbi:ABC transporter ATP-binding protein [Bdellovibrio sp. HCB337]|uniref:ATP-binding cassette domain-containing protein n=1 Tax=Bdellovibrio sp. HCB337 TaxID=3394358 RepID=UPI0039A5F9E6